MELKFYKASFSAPDGFFDSKIIRAESLEQAEEIAEEHRRDCEWPHMDVAEIEDLDEHLLLRLTLAANPGREDEILSLVNKRMNKSRVKTCQGWNCDLRDHCVLYLDWINSRSGYDEPDMDGQPELDHPVGNIPEDCEYYRDAYPEGGE